MNRSEEIQDLAKSLVQANKQVGNPKKNAKNPHFGNDYATLDSVIEAFKQAYLDNGISVIENPVTEEGKIGVSITLLHESGQFITHDPLMLPVGKENAQGYGSSATYARRYALSAIMNIAADDDDDGNQASEQPDKSKRPTQQTEIITQEQFGEIKTKAMQFAEMRSTDVNEVYKALGVFKLDAITKNEASQHINKLDNWIMKAGGKG